MRVNQHIEGALDEHHIVKLVAFIARRCSPASVPNVAVVEDPAPLPAGDDEVGRKDDFFRVARFRGIRQAGSLACEEVADAELAAAVLDGNTAAEGVEFGGAEVCAGEAEGTAPRQ